MFTGLIKDVGIIKNIKTNTEGIEFEIETKLASDIKIDDSVAVNGCCLTATALNENSFIAQAVHLTLEKTALKNLVHNSNVNLELALRLGDRLGGHLVQGHISGTIELIEKTNFGENVNLWFKVPSTLMKYIILEGSIAISGISLTVAKVQDSNFMVTIIPHTFSQTNLKWLNIRDHVNVEVDMMAKYLENFMKYKA